VAIATDGRLMPPFATTKAAEMPNESRRMASERAMAGVTAVRARGRAGGTGVIATAPCW
jgi:hypothetical protein